MSNRFDDDGSPDVATRHASVFEARNKRSQFSRLTDGKKHPVKVTHLAEDEQPRLPFGECDPPSD